jgi:hypothetical protein
MHTLRTVAACLTVGLALAVPGAALADAIPGAAYTGDADGGTITFTISSDGTLVASYQVNHALGDQVNAPGGCVFNAGGDAGVWPGAAIVNDAFSYDAGTAIQLQGSFTGAHTASGTLRFDNAPQGDSHGCDTGTVSWTATTTATPPSGGGSGGSGSGGSGSGGSGSGGSGSGSGGSGSGGSGTTGTHHRRSITTRVVLRKLSTRRLGGRLTASQRACRAARVVVLWRGSKRIGTTRTSAGGGYSFPLSRSLRGRAVRAAAASYSSTSLLCEAASSIFIRA